MYTIISGTNREGSNTLKVAELYQQLLAEKGIKAQLISLVNRNVNVRNTEIADLEREVLIPTQKFIFITPEYNGSFPGVLKALIDITDGKNEKVWQGKKVLLTGVSSGRAGNLRGMEHLTGILHFLKMNVHHNKLPISVVHKLLNKEELISDKETIQAVRAQLDEFIAY